MDRKRLWEGWNLWLGIALALSALCLGAAVPELKKGQPLEAGGFLNIVSGAFSSKTLVFIFPVASVVPYGDAYLRDGQQGFLKFLLVRRGRRDYVRDKVMTCTMSGAVVWLVAGSLAVFFSFLIFFPLEIKGAMGWTAAGGLLAMLLRACMLGSVFANISGFFAAVTESYYMALGLPFVTYYLLIIIHERYLSQVYVMDPKEWLQGGGGWGYEGLGLYLFLTVCLGVAMAAHGAALGARLLDREG